MQYIESVTVINLIRETPNKNLMECEWSFTTWLTVKLKQKCIDSQSGFYITGNSFTATANSI